jgi:hypothetical protein
MNKRKYINKKFFKIWSVEMAYVLGFIFADGNIIRNKRGSDYFSFYSSDKTILIFIKKAMSSNHKIARRNIYSGNVYRLQIGSKEMANDLYKLGLITNKANRMDFPIVPPKYFASFVLGFFDGDGNVWIGKINKKRKHPTIVIQSSFTSASISFLKQLHNNLKLFGIKGGFIYSIRNKNCARLTLSIKDSLKLYKIMYNSDHTPYFLKRKRKTFEKYINMRL